MSQLYGIDPRTGDTLEPGYRAATLTDVEAACAAAQAAFRLYRETDLETRAAFLEAVAEEIAALGDTLTAVAMQETGLPQARLEGERGRTVGQLRLFASVVRAGNWVGARIDPALPDRAPLPRPDLRLRHVAIGPVAVFGASNFPLAFSVAGGDTASALAAGCPVVVKGHPAHPGTSQLVADAIARAVEKQGMPQGVFTLLHSADNDVAGALVADPRIKAVGFTGSRAGGLAIRAIAQSRPEPIPVYAEMSSVNPVILLPAALADRAEKIAANYVASLTLGVGQFCTNPGLTFVISGPAADCFLTAVEEAVAEVAAATMLTPGIHSAFEKEAACLHAKGVALLGEGKSADGPHDAKARVFAIDAAALVADPELAKEIFGPLGVVVRCRDLEEMQQALEALEGQLTIALHMDAADHEHAARLLPLLEEKAGRLLVNGFGTGVEVSHAMVHGGPFPATSDTRTTSVGSLAIDRFLRPVCYQDFPDALLPTALQQDNPFNIIRLVDGELRK